MRFPCLISGVLLALLFLILLITCRIIGLPLSQDAGTGRPATNSGVTRNTHTAAFGSCGRQFTDADKPTVNRGWS